MLYRFLPPTPFPYPPKLSPPLFLVSSSLGQLDSLGGYVSYQMQLGYETDYLKEHPRDLISLIMLVPRTILK